MTRTRKLAATVIVLACLAGVLATGVLAVFTDSKSVGGNAFSTGSVSLTTSPSSALVSFSAMLPGDQVTSPITVTNSGANDVRYAVTSTTTENVLAAQLAMTIKSGVASCTNANFGASGTVVYGPGVLGATTGTNVVGNPNQGAQAGDRSLLSGANEILCVNVSLPLASGNTFASLSSTATLAFQAEQTRNNP